MTVDIVLAKTGHGTFEVFGTDIELDFVNRRFTAATDSDAFTAESEIQGDIYRKSDEVYGLLMAMLKTNPGLVKGMRTGSKTLGKRTIRLTAEII